MIWLWAKLKGYLALAGLIIVALATAYIKGRKGGAAGAHAEAAKQTNRIQKQFDKIDAQKPDFGKAIENLRKRSLDP
jgi:hypothetical protein